MKLFRFCSTAALSFAMAGVLAAQTPQPPTPAAPQTPAAPRAPQPAAQASDAAEMTIVGCIAQAKDAADSYTLTVTPAGAAQTAGAQAPGATPDATRAANPAAKPGDAARTAAAATTPATYKIVGLDADQLKGHVNHQVELKGRVNAAAAASATAKEFRASSVKMLSATCPPAK